MARVSGFGSSGRIRRNSAAPKSLNLPDARKRRFDWDMMWGYLSDEIIRRGDGWVAITLSSRDARFEDIRSGSLQGCHIVRHPTSRRIPNACETAGDIEKKDCAGTCTPRWANWSSMAAPEARASCRFQSSSHCHLTTQGGDVAVTYMNVFHPQAKLADGKFVYDGYLFEAARCGIGCLNQCGQRFQRAIPATRSGIPAFRWLP